MNELIRLQKYLAQCGVASRRKSEELILQGKVKVNDSVVNELGTKINPEIDKVTVNGNLIEPQKYCYILLNKPKGYVCTNKDIHASKTVFDLVPDEVNLHSVGRLDKNTEGLILLTNDGTLTQKLTHPSYEVEKTYLAYLRGRISKKAITDLQKGVIIPTDEGEVKTSPAKVNVVSLGNRTSTIEITIREGRKRQVRLMCKAVGYPVVELKRIREGCLNLKGLDVGRYRFLTEQEVNQLKND